MRDKEVQKLIEAEEKRQKSTLRMIPSECFVSDDVREALSSCFTQKYSEGYPGKRYYQGQENTDKLERLCIERAKKAFNLPDDWHVNVQALSGSPANLAAYFALCNPGDIVVGLGLNSGGHLTHGHTVSITGDLFTIHQFDVDPETHLINYNNLEHFVCNVKPKMMIIGTTAYSRILDWKRLREIANKAGCYFVADVAHVAGLIASGSYPSPVPYADVVTMTTHKTLRGGRGALILCRDEFAKRIDRAVFPYMAGGPHMNNIASIAVALKEATTNEFKKYADQTIKNAKKLASVLSDVYGFKIVSGGTDSHLMVIDLTSKNIGGKTAAIALEKAGIECNYSTIPYDTRPPANPSGIRLGTPILTTIGMKEDDMVTVAAYINKAIDNYNNEDALKNIKSEIAKWLHNIECNVDSRQLELPFNK
jgi:glycine hydroxymethyltransferase